METRERKDEFGEPLAKTTGGKEQDGLHLDHKPTVTKIGKRHDRKFIKKQKTKVAQNSTGSSDHIQDLRRTGESSTKMDGDKHRHTCLMSADDFRERRVPMKFRDKITTRFGENQPSNICLESADNSDLEHKEAKRHGTLYCHGDSTAEINTNIGSPSTNVKLQGRTGWTARHILDYGIPCKDSTCSHCKKRWQYVVDVVDMVKFETRLVCPSCCFSQYSTVPECLLASLNHLSSMGLIACFVTETSEGYTFKMTATTHLLRLVDTFRWFFSMIPFQVCRDDVSVVVIPLQQPVFPMRRGVDYHMKLVGASWNHKFGSGISLYAKYLHWA